MFWHDSAEGLEIQGSGFELYTVRMEIVELCLKMGDRDFTHIVQRLGGSHMYILRL